MENEREKLQLQQAMLQERMGRLQAEYMLAQIQQAEVVAKLNSSEETSKLQIVK